MRHNFFAPRFPSEHNDMTDYEKQSIELLTEIKKSLTGLSADVHWFRQREQRKMDAMEKMADRLQANIPHLPNIG